LKDVAEVLQYLHENDLVHGAFRPATVQMTRQNVIKVTKVTCWCNYLPFDKLRHHKGRVPPAEIDAYLFGISPPFLSRNFSVSDWLI